MTVAFTASIHGLTVYQTNGGAYSVEGVYEGMAVSTAIPLDDGKLCVLLLDPEANTKQTFENLICINQSGALEWRAQLPTSPDVFVSVDMAHNSIFARSWSGHKIRLEPKTGREIGSVLTR